MSQAETAEKVAAPPRRVLVVEDDGVVLGLLVKILTEAGYSVTGVPSGEAALTELDKQLFDSVLLDLNLPGVQGMDVLSVGPTLQTDTPFIVMTAFGSVDTAVEAMKRGAFDYVSKPFRTEELLLTLRRAQEETELRREVARLRRHVKDIGAAPEMVGRSAAMERVRDLITRVAPSRATVLITGETGTGKELVARSIHALSGRAERSFVGVNCSAIPETLLESELFGHVKGAFTGAITNKRGLMEEASGGTLFLDEIGTVTPNIQVKLLRVLQERTIMRVGAREAVPVDIRLIAATNLDLAEEVRSGRFREDLYYRLNVLQVDLPPLRDRPEDIPLLMEHFFGEAGMPVVEPAAMRRLLAWRWPGNVRELRNFAERMKALKVREIAEADLPPELREPAGEEAGAPGNGPLDELEGRLMRAAILKALKESGHNKTKAAEKLGVPKTTLYNKMKKYGIGDQG